MNIYFIIVFTCVEHHNNSNNNNYSKIAVTLNRAYLQKQLPRGVLMKRCSENMQQIYRRTPMLKCDFNKVEHLWTAASVFRKVNDSPHFSTVLKN